MKTTKLQLSLLALFLGCASLQAQYKWADPLKQDFHTVRGQAWQDELKDSYARLPQRAEDKVRKPLWDLSRQSAGLSVAFRSNASEIKVRYVVKGGLSMPHMPATGVSGIDLYATDNNGQERWCAGNYSMGDTIVYNFRGLSYAAKSGNGFEYQLFLPLYNSVSWMEIGVPADASFRFLPVSQEKPLVIYGTSIAQGACASRPGMAWGNILNRKLGHPVINLGFSGNGKLEEALFDLLSEIDARLYIIDCMPNLAGKEASAVVYQRTLEGVKKLREKSRAPILLVEHDGYSNEFSSERAEESYRVANAELRKAYETLQKEQVPAVYYLTKEEIGMPMDAMVDGVHSTDLGMQQYADSYRKKIGEILHEESEGPTSCIPCKQQRDPYDWYGRHEEILKLNKQSAPEVVMIGNSITHFWGGEPIAHNQFGTESWDKLFSFPQREPSSLCEPSSLPIRALISASNAASESLSLSPFRKLRISLKLSIAWEALLPTSRSIRKDTASIAFCNAASAAMRAASSSRTSSPWETFFRFTFKKSRTAATIWLVTLPASSAVSMTIIRSSIYSCVAI